MYSSNRTNFVPESAPIAPVRPIGGAEREIEKFREFLEIRGEKLTEPRRILVRHIFASHKHFDADELVADLHGDGRRVSRATVYRTLRLLVEAGLLRELRLTNRTAYEHDFGYPSHDHLHCTECNTVIEFNNEEVRRLREAVSLEHGFRASGHRFLITGVCPACSRAKSRPRRRLDLI
jgi:Fur family ferric uptake transcriptional regulator